MNHTAMVIREAAERGGYGYPPEKLAITAVVRIDIESLSGKEDLGKGDFRGRGIALLESGTPLPAVLEEAAARRQEPLPAVATRIARRAGGSASVPTEPPSPTASGLARPSRQCRSSPAA